MPPVSMINQLIKTSNKTLEEKMDLIEAGLKSRTITNKKDLIRLIATALSSVKDGSKRYRMLLLALSAIGKAVTPTKTVKKTINGHEYVEMGDGLKWATCNVGASKPEERGNYYTWGDASSTETSDPRYYKWGSLGNYTKYITESRYGTVDNKTVLEPADDAATANMGGTWRMPTEEECRKLMDKTNFNWAWDATAKGFWVISKVKGYEGNKIYFPAQFSYNDGNSSVRCEVLWTSSLNVGEPRLAYSAVFKENGLSIESEVRSGCFNVRGVSF